MKKQISHKLILAITLVCLFGLLLQGCDNVDVKDKSIGNLAATIDNIKIKVSFSLFEGDKNIVEDGTAIIRIVTDLGEVLYTDDKQVSKNDFVVDSMYQLKPTAAYEIEISKYDIKNSTSQNGYVYIKFIAANKEETKERNTQLYGLPIQSNDFNIKQNEEKFAKSAILVNESITKGNLQFTLKRAGFLVPIGPSSGNYGVGGEQKEYFIVELEVMNVGENIEYVYPSNMVIIDKDNNQYDMATDTYNIALNIFGSTGTMQMHEGTKKTGMMAFDKVPKDLDSGKLILQAGSDNDTGVPNNYEFKFNLNK